MRRRTVNQNLHIQSSQTNVLQFGKLLADARLEQYQERLLQLDLQWRMREKPLRGKFIVVSTSEVGIVGRKSQVNLCPLEARCNVVEDIEEVIEHGGDSGEANIAFFADPATEGEFIVDGFVRSMLNCGEVEVVEDLDPVNNSSSSQSIPSYLDNSRKPLFPSTNSRNRITSPILQHNKQISALRLFHLPLLPFFRCIKSMPHISSFRRIILQI